MKKGIWQREQDLLTVATRIDKTARKWGQLTPEEFKAKKNDIITFMAFEAQNIKNIFDETKGVR